MSTTAPTKGNTKPKRVYAELPDDIEIPDVIERLPKPDKAGHEAELATLNATIKRIQERMAVIRTEMDAIKSGRGGYGEQIQTAKAAFNTLKAEKEKLIQQRNHYTAKIKQNQDKKEASIKANRSARSNLRFQTAEEYDNEIQSLRHQQETRSMTLNEEKALVKEIETLQRQKTQVATVVDNKDELDQFNETIKDIRGLQQKKNAEIDAIQEKLTKQKQRLDELYKLNEEEKKQDKFPQLANERKTLKEELDAAYASIKAKRAAFQQANDKYYENIRLVRKKKELERKKEEEARLLEYQTKLAEFEKEMAKIHPYQDELDLCDALLAYLQQTYAKELTEEKKESEKESNNTVVELDGLKPLERKEEDFMAFGAGGKKGKKKGVKEGGKKTVRDVKLSLPIAKLESFATIGLLPPSTVSALGTSLKGIEEKRKWFNKQTTREDKKTGATPAPVSAPTTSPKKKSQPKKFNGADTKAFPSLGGSVATDAPSNEGWGPGMAPPAPVSSYNLADEYEVIEAENE